MITVKYYECQSGEDYIRVWDNINGYETRFGVSHADSYIKMLEDILIDDSPLYKDNQSYNTGRANTYYDFGSIYYGNWIFTRRVEEILDEVRKVLNTPSKKYDNIKDLIKDKFKVKRMVKKSIRKKLNDSSLKSLLRMNGSIK